MELARLLDGNAKLKLKLDACEHNLHETEDAIEDMEFQIAQCRTQKENQLAVLSGEVTYLNEHQVTVQRKSSELSNKKTEVEASTTAAQHKLQRILHANEMATADQRREIAGVREDVDGLQARFEQARQDMRVLYSDKLRLHEQLKTARVETADVEACISRYRRSMADVEGAIRKRG